jgi:hypothetical protein
MGDDVAMFPLGTVLVPGAVLPLHVFEPRYQALVRDCLAGTPEFGVTLIERGSEVGGGDQRFPVGCLARIVEVAELDDGRFALAAVGVRRLRVQRWLEDDPYPRAEVAWWDDPPPGPDAEALVAAATTALRRVLALAAELGEQVGPATVEVSDDALTAAYQLAALAPVGPLDRLALLAAPSPDERLRAVRVMLEDSAAVLAARLAGG